MTCVFLSLTLAIVLLGMARAQQPGLKECPAGRLICQNGGTIAEALCVEYVSSHEAILMECDCPPEFEGINCQIPKSSAACPKDHYCDGDALTENGRQTFECSIDQTEMPSSNWSLHFWKNWKTNFSIAGDIAKLIGHSVHVTTDWSRKEIDISILSRVKRRFSLFFKSDLGPVEEIVKCAGRGCVLSNSTAHCQTFTCSTIHKQFPAFIEKLARRTETKINFGAGTVEIEDVFGFESCKHGTCIPLHPPGSSTATASVMTAIVASVLMLTLVAVTFFMHRETLRPPSKIAAVARAKIAFGRVHSKRKPSGFTIPIGLVWRDLSYVLPARRSLLRCRHLPGDTILKQSSGIVCPGEMVAIIGPSGAGKSTLLDLLGGHKKPGTVTGQMSLTGPQSENYPRSHLLSYVVQSDHFLAVMTVEEEILERVANTLQIVGLAHVATSVVGTPESGGISGGERRRLAVGVELIAEPRVLLLDEVTSGLDSYYASAILGVLREIASKSGMAIVLTIHQPPAATFSLFDRIVLMSSGGNTVFQGAPKAAVEFVQRNGLTPTPYLDGYNPFEYLVSAVSSSKADNAADAYRSSSEFKTMAEEIDTLLSVQTGSDTAGRREKYDQTFVGAPLRRRLTFFQQTSVLTMRSFRVIARDPGLLLVYNFLTLFVALFAGFIFMNLDLSVSGIQNRSGFVFCAILVGSLLSMTSVDSFVIDRILFEKESRAGCYAVLPYFLSKLAVDMIPFRIVPAVIFTCVTYHWIGFQRDFMHFAVFTGVLVLSNAVAGASIFAISTASADVKSANLIGVTYFMFNIVFGGPLLSQAQRQSSSAFLSTFSFFYYAFETMVTNEMMGLPFFVKLADLVQDEQFGNEGKDATGEEMLRTMSWDPSNRVFNLYVLCGMLAGCYVLALVMLKISQRKTR